MIKDKIKKYPRCVVCVQEIKNRLAQIEREINALDERITRGELKHEDKTRLTVMRGIKEARRNAEEKILAKLEGEMLEVERVLIKAAPVLTPLEMLIITKRYVDGLTWSELLKVLHRDPAYSQFRYERSTYMRANKSAMDKLVKAEEEPDGGQAEDL